MVGGLVFVECDGNIEATVTEGQNVNIRLKWKVYTKPPTDPSIFTWDVTFIIKDKYGLIYDMWYHERTLFLGWLIPYNYEGFTCITVDPDDDEFRQYENKVDINFEIIATASGIGFRDKDKDNGGITITKT
jgi:hypothetical protein